MHKTWELENNTRNGWHIENIKVIYLLLTEFEGHTVNYGPRFPHRFMARARSPWAIN